LRHNALHLLTESRLLPQCELSPRTERTRVCVVRKEHAFNVIEFVLEGAGRNAFDDPLEGFARTIPRRDADVGATRYLAAQIGNGEAPFVIQVALFSQELNLRIDADGERRFGLVRITTKMRIALPTWGAAMPAPFAARLVSIRSSMNCCISAESSSCRVTERHTSRSTG
jgi:hypothetical protein